MIEHGYGQRFSGTTVRPLIHIMCKGLQLSAVREYHMLLGIWESEEVRKIAHVFHFIYRLAWVSFIVR